MADELTQRTTPTANGPRVIAGRYRLLGELGRGGMGVVWRAEDSVIGRQVAIKELRLPDGAEDAGVFQERVLREVRTGGRLNDPAVVTVYDVVTDSGTTLIVMELVEAPTLAEVVRQNGPLPPARAAAIGVQVLAALQAAHQAGIVHRDVKPGNIMVGANGRVKLTDFGIAQAVDDPRLTTSGMIIGSPAFMAPERVEGREALPASDLWSLGATLFFAVEGIIAFERPTTAATLHAIMNEVPYLSRTQGPLASAIMGMLITSPQARISAAQAHGLLSMTASGTQAPTPPGGQPHTSAYPGPAPTRVAHGQAPPAPARTGGTAKRLALRIGAGVLAMLLLVGGVLLGRAMFRPATDDARLPSLTYGPGGDLVNVDLGAGGGSNRCYNGQLEKNYNIGSDAAVSCEKPHQLEVFESASATATSPSSDAVLARYPDPALLRGWAESRCALTFYSNAITDGQRAGLQYRAVVPSQQTWDTTDTSGNPERTVYCVVTRLDGGQMTAAVSADLK